MNINLYTYMSMTEPVPGANGPPRPPSSPVVFPLLSPKGAKRKIHQKKTGDDQKRQRQGEDVP